ncbi:MAG: hypothetical protein M5U34_11320 [Chloroflexi bacterium]|nr:hypothetical protein [Chloroflexota bacterium]
MIRPWWFSLASGAASAQYTAGKDHTSHRLVARGFGQREAVLLLYLIGGIFGTIALFVTRASVLEAYLIGGITAVVALYAIFRLEKTG